MEPKNSKYYKNNRNKNQSNRNESKCQKKKPKGQRQQLEREKEMKPIFWTHEQQEATIQRWVSAVEGGTIEAAMYDDGVVVVRIVLFMKRNLGWRGIVEIREFGDLNKVYVLGSINNWGLKLIWPWSYSTQGQKLYW